MPDTLEISGDTLRFGPWDVAQFAPGLPATVRARVEEALDSLEFERITREIDELQNAHAEEIATLSARIAELENELDEALK